jgi:hypothetical protein
MRLFEFEWSWQSRPLGQPWHSLLLAIFAIALLTASAYSYKITRDFVQSAHQSTGIVVRMMRKGDTFYPRVRFTDAAGQPHEFNSRRLRSPPGYSVGEQVQVLYLPDSPEAARIGRFSELWVAPLILGIIGFALTVAAVCLWIFRRALFRR